MLPKGWKITVEESLFGETQLCITSPHNVSVAFMTRTDTYRGDILHQLLMDMRKERLEQRLEQK
jgi:hypothetical protein